MQHNFRSKIIHFALKTLFNLLFPSCCNSIGAWIRDCQIVAAEHLQISSTKPYFHTYMKNIMVRDEVYEKLQKMKRGKESFSDVILRLIERAKGVEVLEKYAGKLDDEELEKVVMGERRKFRVRRFDT